MTGTGSLVSSILSGESSPPQLEEALLADEMLGVAMPAVEENGFFGLRYVLHRNAGPRPSALSTPVITT